MRSMKLTVVEVSTVAKNPRCLIDLSLISGQELNSSCLKIECYPTWPLLVTRNPTWPSVIQIQDLDVLSILT
jgi:hypothetical protein